MKPTLLLLLFIALLFSSCTVTVETRPDGTKVERKEADRDILHFAGDVVRAYSPKRIEPSK